MKKTTMIFVLGLVLAAGLFAQDAGQANSGPSSQVSYLDPANYTRQAMRFEKGGVVFVNSDVYFQLRSVDRETGIDRIEYAINSGSFQNYLNPFNLIEEGYQIIRYRGIDNGDNVENTKVFQVYVDNTAPTASLQTDRALYVNASGVNFASARTRFYVSAVDNEGGSGVKSTYAGTQINSLESKGDGTRSTANFFSITDEGPTTIYFTAMDNVGNLARARQFNVVIDATPPTVRVQPSDNLRLRDGVYTLIPSEELKTEDGKLIITSKNLLGFVAEDNLSGVRAMYVKVNDEDFVQYFSPIEVKGANEYIIQVRAEDNVGNVSEPVTFQFRVDSLSPESRIELINRDGTVLESQ